MILTPVLPAHFSSPLSHLFDMDGGGTSQNSSDLFTEQTCNLIRDFASTRLDIDNKSSIRQDLEKPHKSEILTSIVRLVQEFSRRYQERFDLESLAETIPINPENFSMKEFIELYEGVLTNLFSDINWGRILGMLAFFHLLIDRLAALKLVSEVDTLTSVTSSFVNTHLRDWITTHGGWAGITKLDKKNCQKSNHSDFSWSNINVRSLATGAVGALSIAALLGFVAKNL